MRSNTFLSILSGGDASSTICQVIASGNQLLLVSFYNEATRSQLDTWRPAYVCPSEASWGAGCPFCRRTWETLHVLWLYAHLSSRLFSNDLSKELCPLGLWHFNQQKISKTYLLHMHVQWGCSQFSFPSSSISQHMESTFSIAVLVNLFIYLYCFSVCEHFLRGVFMDSNLTPQENQTRIDGLIRTLFLLSFLFLFSHLTGSPLLFLLDLCNLLWKQLRAWPLLWKFKLNKMKWGVFAGGGWAPGLRSRQGWFWKRNVHVLLTFCSALTLVHACSLATGWSTGHSG